MPAKRAPQATVAKSTAKSSPKPKVKASRMSFDDVMRALEKAGSAQTRKTYLRHGAQEPLFGVSFATLKTLVKRIGADHELAGQLWKTKNHDARLLAIKVADPAKVKASELDRWARDSRMRMCGGYVAMLAAESPLGFAKAHEWIVSSDDNVRDAGWALVGCLASLDESIPDAWHLERLAEIEATIHDSPNWQRYSMNSALIAIGGRNAALRKTAIAAAKRIGKVEVDHGDTSCKTPKAIAYIEKTWTHAAAKRFDSPAAQERSRERMRTRC